MRANDRELAAPATPALKEAMGMQDQIINAVMVPALFMLMRCERTSWRRGSAALDPVPGIIQR